jgi:hypothetical protein
MINNENEAIIQPDHIYRSPMAVGWGPNGLKAPREVISTGEIQRGFFIDHFSWSFLQKYFAGELLLG